jgi:hypothetical protein
VEPVGSVGTGPEWLWSVVKGTTEGKSWTPPEMGAILEVLMVIMGHGRDHLLLLAACILLLAAERPCSYQSHHRLLPVLMASAVVAMAVVMLVLVQVLVLVLWAMRGRVVCAVLLHTIHIGTALAAVGLTCNQRH